MRLQVSYCDHHEILLPAGHKFPVRKYRMLRERLEATGLVELCPAPAASAELIALAHDAAYVRSFIDGSISSSAMRRIGFPWSQGLVDRTLASAGSTVNSARRAMQFGAAGGLAGGTHHAFAAEGAGFCAFNDIAIAIRALQRENAIVRAAVVDLDVHQGDGTAAIFFGDPNVLTFSMHGAKNFPFRKRSSVIDVELEDGTGDAEYLRLLSQTLPEIWEFRPDIVFYQAGVDPLWSDRLGRLSLTHNGLWERDRLVIKQAREREIPIVITLGGGYAEPIEDTVEAHAGTFIVAAHLFQHHADVSRNALPARGFI